MRRLFLLAVFLSLPALLSAQSIFTGSGLNPQGKSWTSPTCSTGSAPTTTPQGGAASFTTCTDGTIYIYYSSAWHKFSSGGSGTVTSIATTSPITGGTITGTGTIACATCLVDGGALGTPASGTATNITGLPISTGVSGLGAGVATFLATPSSANLLAALTTKTGTGSAVFNAAPTFTGSVTFDTQTSASTSATSIYTSAVANGSGMGWRLENLGSAGALIRVNNLYVGRGKNAGGDFTGALANSNLTVAANNEPLQFGSNSIIRQTIFAAGNVAFGSTTDSGEALVQMAGLNSAYGSLIRGTKFTTSGCSVSASVGGATGGTYTSGTTGACTVVITMGGSVAAPAGWICSASDETTPANLQAQSASSTTTCTITGTTVSGDVVSWHAHGY